MTTTLTTTRFSHHRTASGLGIEIPAKRNYFVLVFLAIWIIPWTFGGLFAGNELFFGGAPVSANLFLLVWMVGWAFGWGVVVYNILWQLFGYEMVFVTAGSLVLERRIFISFRRKIFAVAQIKNMISNANSLTADKKSAIGNPSVCFQYGAKTIRFAFDLNTANTGYLLEILKKDMPSVFKSHKS
jgi:hypothetical protein